MKGTLCFRNLEANNYDRLTTNATRSTWGLIKVKPGILPHMTGIRDLGMPSLEGHVGERKGGVIIDTYLRRRSYKMASGESP